MTPVKPATAATDKSRPPAKATRNRKVFPDDDSAKKVVYLAIQEASKKWTMPIRNWKPALNRFSIEFGERVTAHL
jgi:transposase-like protein